MNGDIKKDENKPGRKISYGKTLLLSLVSLLLATMTTLTGGIFGIACTAFSVAFSAAAFFLSSSLLPLAVLPFAYLFDLLLLGDPIVAIGSIEFVAVGLVIATAYKKNCTRTSIICRTTLTLSIIGGAMLLYMLYTSVGPLDIETFGAFVADLRDLFSDAIYESVVVPMNLTELFDYEYVSSLVTYTLVLSPAIFITTYNLIAYLITAAAAMVTRLIGGKDTLSQGSLCFEMSRASAIIYIVAYLITAASAMASLFSGGDGQVSALTAVLDNLVIILTPGLTIIGITDFTRKYKENRSPIQTVILIVMILLFFTNLSTFFCLASLGGASVTLRKKTKTPGGNYAQ